MIATNLAEGIPRLAFGSPVGIGLLVSGLSGIEAVEPSTMCTERPFQAMPSWLSVRGILQAF